MLLNEMWQLGSLVTALKIYSRPLGGAFSTISLIKGRESAATISHPSFHCPQDIHSRQLAVSDSLVIGWRPPCMARMRGILVVKCNC
jgi:hypothetical protein